MSKPIYGVTVGTPLNPEIIVEEISKITAGQKTAEYGEIFNDYVNNIAGIKGIASGRVITIDDKPKQLAFEFDKDTFGEGNTEFPYSAGDVLNHDDVFHLANRFKVLKTENYDGLLYLVIEDTVKDAKGNYFTYTGMDGVITSLDLSKGYFSCTAKPLAGNVIIPDKHMATAMGEGNKSLGCASFVTGRGNKALQDCAAVFGRDNTAGFAATALGRNSDATGEYSFAVGYNANAIGNVGFATGQDTFANGNRSSAFGKGSKANGDGSTAFGHNTYSYGDYTFTQGEGTAAGWGNKVPGQVALGHYNKEDQSAILMVGNGTGSGDLRSNAFVVYEDGRAAIKADPKENLDVSTKQYVDAKTSEVLKEANNAISAINIPVKAQNTHSLYLNKAESNSIDTSTNYAVVSGANCKIAASSIASFIAGGQRNEIKGQNSFAAGYKNKIYGSKSNAFGDSNIIGKVTIESNMVEEYTTAANYTTVFGWNNNAATSNQFVIGKYNDNKSNSLFEIGNGTSTSNRSNAFVVDTSGNGWFAGNITVGDGNRVVATKEYVDKNIEKLATQPIKTYFGIHSPQDGHILVDLVNDERKRYFVYNVLVTTMNGCPIMCDTQISDAAPGGAPGYCSINMSFSDQLDESVIVKILYMEDDT